MTLITGFHQTTVNTLKNHSTKFAKFVKDVSPPRKEAVMAQWKATYGDGMPPKERKVSFAPDMSVREFSNEERPSKYAKRNEILNEKAVASKYAELSDEIDYNSGLDRSLSFYGQFQAFLPSEQEQRESKEEVAAYSAAFQPQPPTVVKRELHVSPLIYEETYAMVLLDNVRKPKDEYAGGLLRHAFPSRAKLVESARIPVTPAPCKKLNQPPHAPCKQPEKESDTSYGTVAPRTLAADFQSARIPVTPAPCKKLNQPPYAPFNKPKQNPNTSCGTVAPRTLAVDFQSARIPVIDDYEVASASITIRDEPETTHRDNSRRDTKPWWPGFLLIGASLASALVVLT